MMEHEQQQQSNRVGSIPTPEAREDMEPIQVGPIDPENDLNRRKVVIPGPPDSDSADYPKGLSTMERIAMDISTSFYKFFVFHNCIFTDPETGELRIDFSNFPDTPATPPPPPPSTTDPFPSLADHPALG